LDKKGRERDRKLDVKRRRRRQGFGCVGGGKHLGNAAGREYTPSVRLRWAHYSWANALERDRKLFLRNHL